MLNRVRNSVEWLSSQLRLICAPNTPQNTKAQDLIEYALLVGFLAVAAGAFIPYSVTAPVSKIFSKIEFYLLTTGSGS